jgi:hypothetical protein
VGRRRREEEEEDEGRREEEEDEEEDNSNLEHTPSSGESPQEQQNNISEDIIDYDMEGEGVDTDIDIVTDSHVLPHTHAPESSTDACISGDLDATFDFDNSSGGGASMTEVEEEMRMHMIPGYPSTSTSSSTSTFTSTFTSTSTSPSEDSIERGQEGLRGVNSTLVAALEAELAEKNALILSLVGFYIFTHIRISLSL